MGPNGFGEREDLAEKKLNRFISSLPTTPKKNPEKPTNTTYIHASFDNRPFIVQLLWLPLWMVLIFFLLPTRSRFNNGNQFPVVSLVTFMTSNQSK